MSPLRPRPEAPPTELPEPHPDASEGRGVRSQASGSAFLLDLEVDEGPTDFGSFLTVAATSVSCGVGNCLERSTNFVGSMAGFFGVFVSAPKSTPGY